MTIPPQPQRALGHARERGQAVLLTVLLLAVGVAAIVYTLTTPAKTAIENDKKTAAALAQARDALIGRAAADQSLPGSLPCPDTNDDGVAELLVGNQCPAYVGRLPWRTLGLPDLRDGSGERLWYTLSQNFRDDNSASPLNSDTAGQLTITGTAPANNVIAIVFAPGEALATQLRSAANQNTVDHYLDGENNNGDTIFTTAAVSANFNDKLMPITREVLFPVVEARVARELRLSLRNYYTANQYFPHAAPLPGNMATAGTYRGYVPTTTPNCPGPNPAPLPADPAPFLPVWFAVNNWQQVMVYAVAPRCTPKIDTDVSINIALLAPPPPCANFCLNLVVVQVCLLSQQVNAAALSCNNTTDGNPAGSLLTVSGNAAVRSVVLPASYTIGAQARPCTGIGDCLEAVGASTENTDLVDNYVYVRPVRSATNNDSLVIVAP